MIVVLSFLLIFVLVVLVIALGSSVLLSLGTGLALIFPVTPVTPFEATVVVLVVAVVTAALWLMVRSSGELEEIVEDIEAEKVADIMFHSVPAVKPRGGKKHRR